MKIYVAKYKTWRFFLHKKWLVKPATKFFLFFLFFGFLPAIGFGQAAFKLINAKNPAKLKFELHRNLIIVQAKLNGKGPFNFLLDTGVNTAIITDDGIRDSLHLTRGPAVAIQGIGEGSDLHAFFSENVLVEMPGVAGGKITFAVLSEDVLKLGNYVGEPVHGILGFDFFNSFAVECNFNTLTIKLFPPEAFKPKKDYQELSLKLEENKPYLFTDIQNGLTFCPVKLIVDTGAGHALSLENNSDKRLKIPEKNMRSQLGMGLSGPVNGYIGRITALQLGKYKLMNLIASFPDSTTIQQKNTVKRNGNLGLELLKRFIVVFDYPHHKLYLKQNEALNRPFEYDMCGLEIVAVPPKYRTYKVTGLNPGSPAELAGILPEDELIAIDYIPATNYSLTQISRLFHSRDGREIDMLFKRNRELINVKVKLKRRI